MVFPPCQSPPLCCACELCCDHPLCSGKWYYECTVIQTEHCATQLGWADLEFIGSNREGVGVGDDKRSWAYDGDRKCLWSGEFRATGPGHMSWGKQWENGDVVGTCTTHYSTCTRPTDTEQLDILLPSSFDFLILCTLALSVDLLLHCTSVC